jgi:hypothetical protein
MDLDRLVRRASEQLAARPSRRGIMSTATKLAAGAGAVLGSLRVPSGAAAESEYPPIPYSCCTGWRQCGRKGRCPKGMKKGWSWFCDHQGQQHLCLDCMLSDNYECTMVKRK